MAIADREAPASSRAHETEGEVREGSTMNYSRCKCGKAEYWDSGLPPKPCQGCEECGTTYARRAEDHKPIEPHDWVPRFNERTGAQDRRMCKRCHAIEKLESLPQPPG